MVAQKIINRYEEAELAEFQALIEKKVEKTEKQLSSLEDQLAEAAESKDNEGDWMDDSSNNTDMEMLEIMANRQRTHLLDLQNALQRIYNKSYGICVITGELIDKRRLMAVPTTTKSLAAKMGQAAQRPVFKPTPKPKAADSPKIISRIISKPTPKVEKPKNWEDEDDLDLEIDDDLGTTSFDIDFDNLPDEDLD